ncbi:MAG: hypothetical protein IPN01_12830 [Deltaproteobacteria bacterium]|nr:hypothetical protein [Deltaproteobacteria bacterium]
MTFSGNQGGTDAGDGLGSKGGAVFVRDGVVNIIGGSFTKNDAAHGGAIWGDSSASLTLTGVAFSGNVATNDGGAVAASSIDTPQGERRTSFTGDTADIGGAIAINSSTQLLVENASFTRTSATTSGGAVAVSYTTTLSKVADSTLRTSKAATPSMSAATPTAWTSWG